MFLLKDCRVSDCEIKNLLIYLGKLVINNYPAIILEYNQKLSTEIKELMTTVINNLQICSQLESRISELQARVNYVLENGSSEVKKAKNEEKKLDSYRNSLELKKERLKQLQLDNYQLLAKIGSYFLRQRLLTHWEEFYNTYLELDEFLKQGGCIGKKRAVCNKVLNHSANNNLNFINA